MKVFIASDIHGSAHYMKRLVEAYADSGADYMVLLGDIFNHGPRNPLPKEYNPMAVAEMLNGIKDRLMVVKGNCDSQVDTLISEFPLVEDAFLLLGKRRIFCTHGHVFHPEHLPNLAKGDVFVYGHFHVVDVEKQDGITILNPGSASLPKDGHHGYILLDEECFRVVDLDAGVVQEGTLCE